MKQNPALILLLTLVLLGITATTSSAQKANTLEIEHWREVLRTVKRELNENYYDPAFNGIDIEARFKVADEKMKNAESMAQLESIVAQFVLELNDTHTFFIPPTDGSRIEYGWRLMPVGLDSYVGAVRPGSDAWALIPDLRGNSRGFPNTLPHFAGYFFDSNLKLADRRGRKDLRPIVAKSKKEKSFKGRLVVLIDGESASAAEIFARVVQLQKRGVVIGDRSAGSVMEGKLYPMHVGIMRAIPCAISATSADVIMPDGTRLEHVGVVPDTLLLPTADDMRASHDPVLAYGASLVGIELDPKKAGELFPTKWNRQDSKN